MSHGAQSIEGAYRSFRDGLALVVPLRDLGPVRVTGADRVDFVHGQVSNDVRGLAEGGTNESLFLNHKGQALAQARVVRRASDLFLAVEAGAGTFVRERFEQHIIFDRVEVEALDGRLAAITIQGGHAAVGGALATLGAAIPAAGSTVSVPFDEATILVTPSSRSAGAGVDIHVLARSLDRVHDALVAAGCLEANPEVLAVLRVEAGIPHAAYEGGEGVLPQEAGLEPLVSYRKGCYLGQEIMARIEARGTVRRGLHRVRLESEPAERDIRSGERTVGRLGTVVYHPDHGWMALAVLRNDLEPHASLVVGPVRATLANLPPFEHPG